MAKTRRNKQVFAAVLGAIGERVRREVCAHTSSEIRKATTKILEQLKVLQSDIEALWRALAADASGRN